jgi:flagellar biosynthesis/type III secretory pathway protein FliH
MMGRGRVLSREQASSAETVPVLGGATPTVPFGRAAVVPFGRVAGRAVVDANAEAAQILADARAEARRVVASAERQIADLKLRAEAEARAEAASKLAAQALALASHEAKHQERGLEQSVALARVLAERLLGASLAVAPEQVVALARQALAEARGARRLQISAHPEDARLLTASLPELGVVAEAVSIAPDPARQRGSLRIETDIGVLDADLAPQLDRLAQRLRETLVDGQ